jgi:hypothetical protein
MPTDEVLALPWRYVSCEGAETDFPASLFGLAVVESVRIL